MAEWTNHVRSRLAPLQLNPAREADIVEEMVQHLELRYEELRARGATDEEAHRLALEELLEPTVLAQQMGSLRQAHAPAAEPLGAPYRSHLEGLWRDVRYALRTLRTRPLFA